SVAPLPLPMRTSTGFLETGLSGKRRIHTLPPRRSVPVMARRADSIWRASTQPWVCACSPNSPKATVFPVCAIPRRLPRNCFRYFVRRGINMALLRLHRGHDQRVRVRRDVALVDPALHADHTEGRVRLRVAVV